MAPSMTLDGAMAAILVSIFALVRVLALPALAFQGVQSSAFRTPRGELARLGPVFVSAWSEKVANNPKYGLSTVVPDAAGAFGNDTTASTGLPCGSRRWPCRSVEDALKVIADCRANLVRKGMAESAEEVVTIRMLTDNGQKAKCRVLLRRKACFEKFSNDHTCLGPANRGLEVKATSNLLLDGNNSISGCSEAILVPPRGTVRNSTALILLYRSEKLTLRNIRLGRNYNAGPGGTPLYGSMLRLELSTFIRLVNLKYMSALGRTRGLWSKDRHVEVINSRYVIFSRCVFQGQAARRDTFPLNRFNNDARTPILYVAYTAPRTGWKAARNQSEWPAGFFQLDGLALPRRPECVNISSSSTNSGDLLPAYCYPSVILFDTEVSGIGSPFDRDMVQHDMRVRSMDKAVGLGITVKLVPNIQPWILIEQCLIIHNAIPIGAPVLIEFNANGVPASFKASASVHINNTEFRKNSALFGGGMMIRFNKPSRRQPLKITNLVLLTNCKFSYNSAAKEGGGLVVQDKSTSSTVNNCVKMSNVSFLNNSVHMYNNLQTGGAVSVTASKRRPDGKRLVGMQTNYSQAFGVCMASPTVPAMHWHSITYTNNSGSSSVSVRNAEIGMSGYTSFADSRGSAVMLQNSRLVVTGALHMRDNLAERGACFSINKGSQVNLTQVANLTMERNYATKYGAVAYADAASSTLTIGNALYTRRDDGEHAISCPFLLPLKFWHRTQQFGQFFFSNGAGWDKPTGTIFMASLSSCFSDYTTLFPSLFDVQDPRFCMPYAPASWEMVRDDAKCDEDYCEVRKLFSSTGPCLEGCATPRLGRRLSCRPRSLSVSPSTSPWPPHTAGRSYLFLDPLAKNGNGKERCLPGPQGNHRVQLKCNLPNRGSTGKHSSGERHSPEAHYEMFFKARDKRSGVCQLPPNVSCSSPTAYTQQPHQLCFSNIQKLFVMNMQSKPYGIAGQGYQPPFSTRPAWLVFKEARTSCYKMVGDNVWYFYDTCRRSDILQQSLTHSDSFHLPLKTDCTLFDLARQYSDYRHQLPGVLPGYVYVLVPWSSLILCWDNYIAAAHTPANTTSCQLDAGKSFAGTTTTTTESISDMTLHPAPGEQFSLQVDALDEMFNVYSAPLSIEVEADNDDVLLGRGTFIVKSRQTELFTSDDSIRRLSLYGTPNSTGALVIRVQGDLTFSEVHGGKLELRIPFRLRSCHLGFQPVKSNPEQARELLEGFRRASCKNMRHYVWRIKQELSCTCSNSTLKQCVTRCDYGKRVFINSQCWAGHQTKFTPPSFVQSVMQPQIIKPWFSIRRQDFLGSEYMHDPIGRLDGVHKFAAVPCYTGTCSYHDGVDWLLGQDNPCATWSHTGGPLCTGCLHGFEYNMAGRTCVSSQGHARVSLAVYFALLFLLCLLVFIIVLLLNVGVLPSLDSWLFFAQGYFCIRGGNVNVEAAYTYVVTLGLGWLCVTEDLTPMVRQASVVAPPLFSLILLGLVYFVGNRLIAFRFLKKLQRRKSIRHVLWLIILWSSTLLVYSGLLVLRPVQLDSHPVLFIDPTVGFFSPQHLPYAIAAITMMVLFVLPAPILLIWQPTHIIPSLIGLIDEATCMYEPSRRWWGSFNIIRRIIFGIVMGTVTNSLHQRIAMAILCVIMLAMHSYFRPFRRDSKLWRIKDADNTLELFLLTNLTIVAIFHLIRGEVPSFHENRRSWLGLSVFCVSTFISLSIYIYRFTASWRETLASKRNITLAQLWTGCDHPDCHGSRCSSSSCHADEASEQETEISHCRHHLFQSESMTTDRSVQMHTGLRDPLLMDMLLHDR